ncbi:SDR family NAD(P)-dependent oxidoreductase [Actinoalloteichus spitiensis]|uniref:SDR family NAD(P)-dependent oxidoreductase n=1 Tax=Actinoalloteichus spitiensis TaxID=252394 RepID=UPI001B7FEED5|nr:SDR family NAD(P)-dependent oxidoreductase [Actinoalloteichus spitiensis]
MTFGVTMVKDLVVSGGTTGMGAGLARHYLAAGARVTVVGRNPERARRFLEEASTMGAGERAHVIRADLTSVAENRRVIAEIRERHDSLDALVLSAMVPFRRRVETPDGHEGVFSLYYVSRLLLSYGLTDLLEQGDNPVILSIGGTGMTKGRPHWDDLTLRNGWGILRATLQGGRANDLLGVGYPLNHPDGRTRFVLVHPGYTNSGLNGVPQPAKALMAVMGALFARSVSTSIAPIIRLIDEPSDQRLIAWDRTKPVDLGLSSLDPGDARRLFDLTRHLVAED